MYMNGKYYFLSNYYYCYILYEGITYSSAEAAFQAQKEINYEDRRVYADLLPWEAKKKGRGAKLRPDWETVKDNIMFEIVEAKFEQNPELIPKLLAVTEPIVEDNSWNDNYWGVCNGRGENKLGKILEEIKGNYQKKEKEKTCRDRK